MDNSTYVTLLSNSSLKYYPENTLSRFTVKLPNVINFDANEKWYVGLMNVAHTSICKEKDIPAKILIKSSVKQGMIYEKLINLLNAAPEFYQKIKENSFFERYMSATFIEFNKYDFSKLGYNQVEYKFDFSKLGYIQVELLENVVVKIHMDVEYTPEDFFDNIFSQIEKSKWKQFIESFQNDIKQFKMTTETKDKILKMKNNYVKEITKQTFILPFYMCFYCDIIKPRIIGDTSIRCLYMNPLGAYTDKSLARSYQIDNIQYCLIENNNISEISILITDENGEQINFDGGLFMTSLVLHFRKGI